MGAEIIMGPFAWFKWQALFVEWPVFLEGFVMTIALSILALLLSLVLGILFGVLGTAQYRPLRWLNRVYVEFIQNTPLVIRFSFYIMRCLIGASCCRSSQSASWV